MSDITIAGSTSYPSSLDTRTVLQDGPVSGNDMVAANINGPAAAVLAIETTLGTTPQGSASSLTNRLATSMNNDGTIKSSVIAGAAVTYSAGVFTVSAAPPNFSISASVAANALTINLLAQDGSALSAAKPAVIPFRNVTLTTGVIGTIAVTGATSITVPSGTTLGTSNSVATRLYVGAINNAGTVELCIWNPVTTSGLFGINEAALYNTTAISGGNSAGVIYSTSSRTGVPITIIGFIEISEVTAGTWNASPSVVQTMAPGVRRTGDVVQIASVQTGTVATGTTAAPADNTAMTSTQGDQYISVTLTPTSAINRLAVTAIGHFASTADIRIRMGLFQDTTTPCLAETQHNQQAASICIALPIHYEFTAGTASATTLKIRAGGATGPTVTFNGEASNQLASGKFSSGIWVSEVFA